MDLNKCLTQAEQMASKAKPFILEHNGHTYTGVFSHTEWVYQVYEDGFFLMNVNTKSSTKAKTFVKEWLKS